MTHSIPLSNISANSYDELVTNLNEFAKNTSIDLNARVDELSIQSLELKENIEDLNEYF